VAANDGFSRFIIGSALHRASGDRLKLSRPGSPHNARPEK
jgi:hypothetical protein